MKQKPESVSRQLLKHGIPGVECSVIRSRSASKELADWAQIVKAWVKLAAKAGYKGVINDIRLAGFSPPAVRQPDIRDACWKAARRSVLIIGGGVIGCAIARELSRRQLDILLCDKESDVAMHASSRNDGMIHPGIASHPGTLRGDMNVLGNAMYTDICRDLSIPFERYGSLILYSERWFGLLSAPVFAMREKKFGIEGRKISRKTLRRLEPNITDKAVGAFEYPSSGVLSPYIQPPSPTTPSNSASVCSTVVESILTERQMPA